MANTIKMTAAGIVLVLMPLWASAQIVESSPTPLQQSSKNVVITYHADQGNAGLKGYTASQGIYAHAGVITSASSSGSDWKHAPTWLDNSAKYALKYVSTDTWQLEIGDINDYFGISDGEVVKQLAFVFRNATGSAEGKTASGGDIYIDVVEEGFSMNVNANVTGTVVDTGTTVTFTVNATQSASLALYVNDTLVKSGSGTSMSADYEFVSTGQYTVKGTATTAAGSYAETTLSYVCLGAATAQNYPWGSPKENMGARVNSDGTVTFCLAAPEKESVILVGSWDNYETRSERVMYYHDYEGYRYFWTTVSGLDMTTDYPYYYLVDRATKVGDPYARLVLDYNYDKSLKVTPEVAYPYDLFSDTMLAVFRGNIDEYDWKYNDFEIPDHSQLVIYELLLRDFTGSDSTADGTLARALSKLNYLSSLGVNAIELMPIMEFNANNSWGYNTNFYMAPDKAYGTIDDYRQFIDECHRHGFAVILDIVFNQSDGLHPWYQMYDTKSNPFYNATAPHDYSVLNDWKQENPLVEQQWKDALQYWLSAYNVDGFRFDLVKGLGDSDSYTSGTDGYNQTRVDRMLRLHEYIKEIKPDAIHINENFVSTEDIQLAADSQLGWYNMNNASCQTAMGYTSSSAMDGFYDTKHSYPFGGAVSYAESHDEERMGYKNITWGVTGVKDNHEMSMRRLGMVAAQMLMVPGAKMIWQFQELGADQTTKSSSGGNDTGCKKVLWNYLDDEYRAALCQTYKEMIHFRTKNPALFQKETTVNMSYTTTWTNGRWCGLRNGDAEAVLLVNPNTETTTSVSYTTNALNPSNCQVYSKSYNTAPNYSFSGSTVTATLAPGAYLLLGSADLASLGTVFADSVDEQSIAFAVGSEGRIIINGDYRNVTVCNLAGQTMPSLTVPVGLYIVNIDGRSQKVVVK